MRGRNGQVALYLVMALLAIAVFVLTDVSAFLAVRAKNHAMNAGDAAALASARVQAELLNRIGRLNVEHAVADAAGDYARSLEIVREQRRLAFLGPLDCLREAQRAARENGAEDSPKMAAILSEHVSDIRQKYMQFPELYPEPWEGAWAEYAAGLASAVAEGVVAGTDNIDFIDAVECFPLTSKSFYAMIEGEAWCKLVVAGWTGLLNMDSRNLPDPTRRELSSVVNSEICSLHLAVKTLEAASPEEQAAFRKLLELNGAVFPPGEQLVEDRRAPDDPSRCYFFYDTSFWRDWIEMDPGSKFRFPILGKVKPVFNVMGCASVFRVRERYVWVLDETDHETYWSAAAKPFGKIWTPEGEAVVTAEEAFGLVLPAFEEVRLIPLSAAYVGCEDTSTADAAWLHHIRDHVASYFAHGTEGLNAGCRYCRSLLKWEDPEFRARVSRWIDENGASCTRSSPGPGPALEGGTPYAH